MSQTVTKTNDSLTVIPTKHLKLMIKDLEAGDKSAKKLSLVENNLSLCETKNQHLDSLLSIAESKEILYKENIQSYQSIIGVKDSQIGKLKKSRKLISVGGTIIIALTFIL
jgi:plasmid rolling circle replication initiator protein Rep